MTFEHADICRIHVCRTCRKNTHHREAIKYGPRHYLCVPCAESRGPEFAEKLPGYPRAKLAEAVREREARK